MKKSLLLLLLTCTTGFMQLFAQDYYDENRLRFDDYIYQEGIKSAQLFKNGFELSRPYIQLNTNDKLKLSFDDLYSEGNEYEFTVIHCNVNWEESGMQQMEYMEGRYSEYFGDGEQSINTSTSYMHYETTFPTMDMRIVLSGNYLLKVYEADEPDNIILTKRFYVYEPKVRVTSEVKIPRSSGLSMGQHELMLDIDISSYPIHNVYGDLKVFVQQNGRKDNIKKLTKPKSVKGDILSYNIISNIMFEAGNEFRGIDTRSLIQLSPQVLKTYKDSLGLNIVMRRDGNRQRSNYLNYEDLNGWYQVITRDPVIRSSHIEADYGWVHLRLQASNPYSQGAVYIVGAFNDWKFDESNKMTYNYQTQDYEAKLFLKQGYYAYMYAFLPNGKTEAMLALTEGSHVATDNTYSIYVYYRSGGEMYDRLIAIETIESKL